MKPKTQWPRKKTKTRTTSPRRPEINVVGRQGHHRLPRAIRSTRSPKPRLARPNSNARLVIITRKTQQLSRGTWQQHTPGPTYAPSPSLAASQRLVTRTNGSGMYQVNT